ncbi:hypothetical protein JCM11491_003881 [Sporobolomyces phaffii]
MSDPAAAIASRSHREVDSARPHLTLSTTTAASNEPLGSPRNDAASSSDTIRGVAHAGRFTTTTPPQQDVTPRPSSHRGHSHGRSHSMSDHHHHHHQSYQRGGGMYGAIESSGFPPQTTTEGDSSSTSGSTMGDSFVSTATTSTQATGGAQLARRNNTVGASNSRLVRLERNRARIALQGAGLSEEDQEFYVPPSPARTGPYANVPWSDVGHGASSSPDLEATAFPSLVSPTAATFDHRHARSFSHQSDVGAAAAAWARAPGTRLTEPSQHHQQQQHPIAPEPKRSSFVVLRGGKGDAKLTERRPANAVSPPPHDYSAVAHSTSPGPPDAHPQAIDIGAPPGATQLRHKNSLKPFLDQEREEREQGGKSEEDWERGLMDERKSGAEGGAEVELDDLDEPPQPQHSWLQSDPYATLKTPPLSSSFPSQLSSPFGPSHSRSSTFHAPSRNQTDPWSSSTSPGVSAFEEEASIRRHQSLTSFRSREPSEASRLLSTSPGSTSNEPLEHLARAHSLSQQQHHSTAATIAGFGSRSRSGTSPAPLTLQHSHSLGHASTHSPRGGAGGGGLSHSNSLGSKKSSLSLSGEGASGGPGAAGTGGALSPSLGVAMSGLKSPWSPTEEETKQLGMGPIATAGGGGGGGSISPNGSASLSRGGSGSSRGSQPAATTTVTDEAVNRLGEQFGAIPANYHLEAPPTQIRPGAGATNLSQAANPPTSRRLAPLMTTAEALSPNLQHAFASRQGPASASAFVPPIGHSHHSFARGGGMGDIIEHPSTTATANLVANPNDRAYPPGAHNPSGTFALSNHHHHPANSLLPSAYPSQPPPPLVGSMSSALPSQLHPQHASAFPGGSSAHEWSRQKEFLMGSGLTNHAGSVSASTAVVPPASLPFSSASNPALPPQSSVSPADWNLMQQQQAQISLLQSQMAQALKAMDAITAQTGQQQLAAHTLRDASSSSSSAERAGPGGGGGGVDDVAETPIDVNSLVAKKGYNPTVFDLRPQNARFFVIKSYTEEDVHKSLKYEIWASTDLGNKRLDKAFKESADKGPIYLFFSVNASGHFAGMAQMLTPVDYSLTSNVWASDKWKGVLKVRWIYIKDVPLNALRHIRLNNTPENKPVTSSRDTQEVPYDAGLEVLRIIATYQSRASLLQDFGWYEAQHRLDRSNEENGSSSEVVVPPRQAHYARPDRNQPSNTVTNGTTPAPAPPSSVPATNYSQYAPPPLLPPGPLQQQQHPPPPPPTTIAQAYPQYLPPTPPYQQLPSHGFSPSPPPQQQQQQRQPFRSFWRGPNSSSPSAAQQNGSRPPHARPTHAQFDGPGVAY